MPFIKFYKKTLVDLLWWLFLTCLLVLPFVWWYVEHPAQFQQVYHTVTHHKLFFTLLRMMMIGGIFLGWPYFIAIFSKKHAWSKAQQIFWYQQRFALLVGLLLFEFVICENGLVTLLTFGKS